MLRLVLERTHTIATLIASKKMVKMNNNGEHIIYKRKYDNNLKTNYNFK